MFKLFSSDGYYILDGTSMKTGYDGQCNTVPVSFSETYHVFDSQWSAFNSHQDIHSNQEFVEKFKPFRTDANMYRPYTVDFKPIQFHEGSFAMPCITGSNELNGTSEPKYFETQATIHEANQLINQGDLIGAILGSSSSSSADLSCHVDLSTNALVPFI